MGLRIRGFAWVAMALAIIPSLTVGAALAHEGRPVGDHRFIVGWLEEPTYEGSRNAVSVRVNKIVEGGGHANAEGQQGAGATPSAEHDTSTAHHAAEATPSAEHDTSTDHHAAEATPSAEHDTSTDHHRGDDRDGTSEGAQGETGETGMSGPGHHGVGGDHGGPIAATSAMSVEMEASIDPLSGVNVHIMPTGFTFSPESVNLEHVAGEGHAHIYVDGVKLTRVYSPWFHLDGLAPGEQDIEIRLNANNHSEYTWNGEVVKASTRVVVPEPNGQMHHQGPQTTAADAEMSVSISVEPDPLGGANLFITGTKGFTFAPQNAGASHIGGEGHAHVYVNDVKVSRVYGKAFQLGRMAEGMNKVRVTLNANDHSEYTWNGEVVQATTSINIAEGMGGDGYGTAHANGDSMDISYGEGHHGTEGDDDDEESSNGEGHHGSEGDDDGEESSNGEGHHGSDGDDDDEQQGHTSRSSIPQGMAKPQASITGQETGVAAPVDGLEGSISVEVRHVASGETRVLDLEAVAGDPGHYIAGLVPTAPGVYEFRVFGDVDGIPVDETFVSAGAGGGFDDVRTSAELQFPVVLPEVREIESGVRGALQTAQLAQEAALAAQNDQGSNVLAIIALVVGIIGAVLGTGGIYFGLRSRQG